MILEGFDIQNWSCIKKVSVSDLPATGVIVIHGPNRNGKSSIVQALRACLMDYLSTTKSQRVTSCYPRGTGEKPIVSVMFRVGDATYRIRKNFGTNRSELASKTSTGDWKVETSSPTEAHDRTCGYVGGDDSSKGLHQLLWLTQGEFRLPDPKELDQNVQGRLRGILGVLQTPLDDRFLNRVTKRWSVWYRGRRRFGKQHEIKEGCMLAERIRKLEGAQTELTQSEAKFNEVERLLEQSIKLEEEKVDLQSQLEERTKDLKGCYEERDRSQTRITARRLAEERYSNAEKERNEALEERRLRTDAAQRWFDDESAIEPVEKRMAKIGERVSAAVARQEELGKELSDLREQRRKLQERAQQVNAKLRKLELGEKVAAAEREITKAQAISEEIEKIEKYILDHPVPGESTWKMLKTNRQQALKLQAELEAASMNLDLVPEIGASSAKLALDGGDFSDLPVSEGPISKTPRRKADLIISGWGRVELSRGAESGDLDQVEEDLRKCLEEFADAVSPFGISATDPHALDTLFERAAEVRQRKTELSKKEKDLKQVAAKGLDDLRAKVVELETRLTNITVQDPKGVGSLPAEQNELELLATKLKDQLSAKDEELEDIENEISETETNLTAEREKETNAKEELAGAKAKAKASREEVERLRTEEQIIQRIEHAKRALEECQSQLEQSELTPAESTIGERVEAAEEAVNALEKQIKENTRNYHEIKGRLLESEGLHARRSSLAARVDELTCLTERESLEKDAVNRLYELFEECREKQLGTLMGPIQDRLVSWMRVLDIGDYGEVRFNDAFLPDKLIRRDGTAEFTIHEESTGAQEQIGMLVRLALGSSLSSKSEPAVAILDDPLTHCDIGRLNKMRIILRRAAEGDPKVTPPAGPLQVIILTCHPEWFRDERAMVIDLANSDIMSRYPG